MHRTLASLLVLVALSGPARAAGPSKKDRATAAFRAKRFAVACPLFAEVVTEQPDDGWGWNDLALCRARLGELEQAVVALQRAAGLAAERSDDALTRAIATNGRLVAKALLARTTPDARDLRLSLETSRLFLADEQALECQLVERVKLAAEASLEGDDWLTVADCLERARAPERAVLRVMVRAFAHGAKVGAAEYTLPEPAGDWKSNCRPLDGAECGRQWLLCTQRRDEGGVEHVVIEAASLAKWARSPFTQRAHVIASSSVVMELPCPGPDGLTAHDLMVVQDVALGFDACASTWVRWEHDDQTCADDGVTRLTEQRFTLAAP
ncbi:MAG: tetratricopeptide repeat protein [Myxococcota bacterium]